MGDSLSKTACIAEEESETDGKDGGFHGMTSWFWGGSAPADSIIIFDWDDTLLCTTSVLNFQHCDADRLLQLEHAVEAVLTVAMGLGDTFIVTNGVDGWIQQSSHSFLPRLMPLLQRLSKVVSARSAYEQMWPGEPTKWKQAAFEKILLERKSSSRFTNGVNLLVLGDSLAEIEAAQTATQKLRGRSIIKTIKFKEMPSIDELLGQLRIVTQVLPDSIEKQHNFSQALIPRQLPPHLSYLLAWASGWQVANHEITESSGVHQLHFQPTSQPVNPMHEELIYSASMQYPVAQHAQNVAPSMASSHQKALSFAQTNNGFGYGYSATQNSPSTYATRPY